MRKPKCPHCKRYFGKVLIDYSIPDKNWYLYRCSKCLQCIAWVSRPTFEKYNQEILNRLSQGIFKSDKLREGFHTNVGIVELSHNTLQEFSSGSVFVYDQKNRDWKLLTLVIKESAHLITNLPIIEPKTERAKRLLV